MKKYLLLLAFICLASHLGAKTVYDYDISVKFRPIFLSPQVDYNMYFDFFHKEPKALESKLDTDNAEFKKNDIKNTEKPKLYRKNEHFTNYLGFSVGTGVIPSIRNNFIYFNFRLSDKMMFNPHHGLIISANYQTWFDWFEIFGEVEYIYNFNDKFGLNISLLTYPPVRFIHSYSGKVPNAGDMIGFLILTIYDFGYIGLHFSF